MIPSRVLCVHENGAVLRELQQSLAKTGCAAVLAKDGDQAVRILHHEQIDGIVLSYDIQIADGHALRNQIRHVCPDLPVLLFSNMDEIRDVPLQVFSDYLQHQDLPTLAAVE